MFNALLKLKKDVLMLEYIRYGKSFSDGLFSDFVATHKDPKTIAEVESQIIDFDNLICSYIPDAIKDFLDSCDEEVYLSQYHYRKYPNEIENDVSVSHFLEKALEAAGVEVADSDEMKFSLKLYDFNDYDVYFVDEDEAKEFLNNHHISTCTSFEKIDDYWSESWSI